MRFLSRRPGCSRRSRTGVEKVSARLRFRRRARRMRLHSVSEIDWLKMLKGAAGLEMTLLGGTFRFSGGCGGRADGLGFRRNSGWRAYQRCGLRSKCALGRYFEWGRRALAHVVICACTGGIQVKPFLGSASTHLLSGLGGHQGRALRKGDALKIGTSKSDLKKTTVAVKALERSLRERSCV